MKKNLCAAPACQQSAVYGVGLLGALVYYVKASSGVVGFLVAIFKALVWPAFLVFDLLNFLH